MKDNLSARRTCAALCILCLSCSALFGQGPLPPPPGAPGPTMKTLDQLDAKLDATSSKVDAKSEKRIPIDADHTPGDNANEFIIKSAGSYYLTGNLLTSKYGIEVASPGVTIDLNGFQIKGAGGGYGII